MLYIIRNIIDHFSHMADSPNKQQAPIEANNIINPKTRLSSIKVANCPQGSVLQYAFLLLFIKTYYDN